MTKRKLFEQYLETNLNQAYRFAYSYTQNKEDAEDVVNESVEKALKSIHTLKDNGALKQWFYRIIANTAISLKRSQSKVIQLNIDDITEGLTEDDPAYGNMDAKQIFEAMDYRYREVMVLRFFEDMTFQEAAEVLGLSENTVKTRYYKALKLLKAEFKEDLS